MNIKITIKYYCNIVLLNLYTAAVGFGEGVPQTGWGRTFLPGLKLLFGARPMFATDPHTHAAECGEEIILPPNPYSVGCNTGLSDKESNTNESISTN